MEHAHPSYGLFKRRIEPNCHQLPFGRRIGGDGRPQLARVRVRGRGRLDKARFALGVFDRERVAPLNKALVECEEPLCGSLNTGHETFSQGYYQLWCEDADVETMEELPREGAGRRSPRRQRRFDAERWARSSASSVGSCSSGMSASPPTSVSQTCLEAFLYGPSWNADTAAKASETYSRTSTVSRWLKTAMAVTVDEWTALPQVGHP